MTFSCIKFKRKFKMRLNPSIEGSKSSLSDTTSLPRKKNSLNTSKESRHSMIIESSSVALTKSDKLTRIQLNSTNQLNTSISTSTKPPLRTKSDLKLLNTEKFKIKKFFSTDLNPFRFQYPQLPAPPVPPPPPPPPPPLPPFASLRDLPSLASLPSIPNSFVATSVNSATFASSTATESSNSRNRFGSSTNVLIKSNSDSKASSTSNRNLKTNEKNNIDSNDKQITKVVGKMITYKVDKSIAKRSSEKLNQQEQFKTNSKQLQKQRMQLYDRINLQNKLKEHTYSPLHFWAEKKVASNINNNAINSISSKNNDNIKKINSKNFFSLDQLNDKPQLANVANNNTKKNPKNYISYKLKTDLKHKNKSTNKIASNTKNEHGKIDLNLSVTAKKANSLGSSLIKSQQQQQLQQQLLQQEQLQQMKNIENLNKLKSFSKESDLIRKKSLELKKKFQNNEEYNYAVSNKSISSIDESDTSSEEYISNISNTRKEYEIKILTTNNTVSNEKCEEYDDPQFQNEYDDVDENIIVESRMTNFNDSLAAISNNKSSNQCECKYDNKNHIKTNDSHFDDIIACTSF